MEREYQVPRLVRILAALLVGVLWGMFLYHLHT